VNGKTLTTDKTALGIGIKFFPSFQVAVIELSAVSVAVVDASERARLTSSEVMRCLSYIFSIPS